MKSRALERDRKLSGKEEALLVATACSNPPEGRARWTLEVPATCIDLALVAVFALQHSAMARPWFKRRVMGWIPEGLERATYVHVANAALFILILLWQPIPTEAWNVEDSPAKDVFWLLFGAGWAILFLGAWSFGLRELLGLEQARAWTEGRPHASRLCDLPVFFGPRSA